MNRITAFFDRPRLLGGRSYFPKGGGAISFDDEDPEDFDESFLERNPLPLPLPFTAVLSPGPPHPGRPPPLENVASGDAAYSGFTVASKTRASTPAPPPVQSVTLTSATSTANTTEPETTAPEAGPESSGILSPVPAQQAPLRRRRGSKDLVLSVISHGSAHGSNHSSIYEGSTHGSAHDVSPGSSPVSKGLGLGSGLAKPSMGHRSQSSSCSSSGSRSNGERERDKLNPENNGEREKISRGTGSGSGGGGLATIRPKGLRVLTAQMPKGTKVNPNSRGRATPEVKTPSASDSFKAGALPLHPGGQSDSTHIIAAPALVADHALEGIKADEMHHPASAPVTPAATPAVPPPPPTSNAPSPPAPTPLLARHVLSPPAPAEQEDVSELEPTMGMSGEASGEILVAMAPPPTQAPQPPATGDTVEGTVGLRTGFSGGGEKDSHTHSTRGAEGAPEGLRPPKLKMFSNPGTGSNPGGTKAAVARYNDKRQSYKFSDRGSLTLKTHGIRIGSAGIRDYSEDLATPHSTTHTPTGHNMDGIDGTVGPFFSSSGGGGEGARGWTKASKADPGHVSQNMVRLEALGHGATGCVYKAVHATTLQLLAIKEVPVYDKARRDQIGAELLLLKHCRQDQEVATGVMDASLNGISATSSTTAAGGAKDLSVKLAGSGNSGRKEENIEDNAYPTYPTSESDHTEAKQMEDMEVEVKEVKMREITKSSLVTFYDAFTLTRAGYVSIAMEYCSGGSLQDLIQKRGALGELSIASVALDMVKGLQYIHHHNMLHRDIKPSNILINGQGHVKLADFGLVLSLEPEDDPFSSNAGFPSTKWRSTGRAHQFVGTALYMSPERLQGEPYGFPADVWSLGLTLITLAVGEYPLEVPKSNLYWNLVKLICPQMNSFQSIGGESFNSDDFGGGLEVEGGGGGRGRFGVGVEVKGDPNRIPNPNNPSNRNPDGVDGEGGVGLGLGLGARKPFGEAREARAAPKFSRPREPISVFLPRNKAQEVGLSDKFLSFVRGCLRYEPEDRLTADELLGHPFLQLSPSQRGICLNRDVLGEEGVKTHSSTTPTADTHDSHDHGQPAKDKDRVMGLRDICSAVARFHIHKFKSSTPSTCTRRRISSSYHRTHSLGYGGVGSGYGEGSLPSNYSANYSNYSRAHSTQHSHGNGHTHQSSVGSVDSVGNPNPIPNAQMSGSEGGGGAGQGNGLFALGQGQGQVDRGYTRGRRIGSHGLFTLEKEQLMGGGMGNVGDMRDVSKPLHPCHNGHNGGNSGAGGGGGAVGIWCRPGNLGSASSPSGSGSAGLGLHSLQSVLEEPPLRDDAFQRLGDHMGLHPEIVKAIWREEWAREAQEAFDGDGDGEHNECFRNRS